jgi:urease accessory protein
MNHSAATSGESSVKGGQAELEVDLVFGESTVTTAFASSPLKLLTPCSRGRSAWACVSSFGGGFVAGDQTRLDVRVGTGARCFVGSQASTKVYRNPSLLPCGHVTRAELEPEALLVFAPDPVQAFAGSTYVQRQEFYLAAGAGLVLVDWFTSGRAARGERWEFKQYQSRNEVFIDGERVFLDSLLLDPEQGELAAPHRMDRFNCLATLLVIGAPFHAASEQLLKEIAEEPVAKRPSLLCSASPVRDGALLRVAGEDVESVGRELNRRLTFVHEILGDNPWVRKW